MRTFRGLFELLTDADHLERAATLALRGKRRRSDCAWFLFRREDELARLRSELLSGQWRPTGFERVYLRDPKPRIIARAPIADRVVHAALVKAMEPALTRSLRPECFACRPGLGTHRAVLRLLEYLRRHRYCVHLDVRAYFPSIDRDVVRALLARRIRDARFLAVIDRVLDSGADVYDDPEARTWAGLTETWPPPGRGLPIGAYTSQVLAAWLYLDALDHHVKRTLKVPGYLRYVDDLFLFGRTRGELRRWRAEIGAWLWHERGLKLKHPEARVLSCAGHLDALGQRITRAGIGPLPRALRRLARAAAAEVERRGRGRRPAFSQVLPARIGGVMFG